MNDIFSNTIVNISTIVLEEKYNFKKNDTYNNDEDNIENNDENIIDSKIATKENQDFSPVEVEIDTSASLNLDLDLKIEEDEETSDKKIVMQQNENNAESDMLNSFLGDFVIEGKEED